jgi:hypothetical protein
MVPDTRSRLEAALVDLEAVLVRGGKGMACAAPDLADLAPSSPSSPCLPALSLSLNPPSLSLSLKCFAVRLSDHTIPPPSLLLLHHNTPQDATPADAVDAGDLAAAQEVAAAAKAKLGA